jgi:hypothetical protein
MCPIMIGIGRDETEAVEQLHSTPVMGESQRDIDNAIAWARRNGKI